jgi:arabinose-5-phosphate isomerase
MITDADIVLALSNSGETDELLMLLPGAQAPGQPAGRDDRSPASTLARESDVHLDVSVPAEACPLALGTHQQHHGGACAWRRTGRWRSGSARLHRRTNSRARIPAGALGRRLLLHITDVMHSGSEVPARAGRCDAERSARRNGPQAPGHDAVVDADDHLLGLYTDGDLRRTLDDAAIDLRSTRIDAVMTRTPKTIGSDALAVEAAQLMEAHQINALLVLDDARRVVGALNIHDLLRARVV